MGRLPGAFKLTDDAVPTLKPGRPIPQGSVFSSTSKRRLVTRNTTAEVGSSSTPIVSSSSHVEPEEVCFEDFVQQIQEMEHHVDLDETEDEADVEVTKDEVEDNEDWIPVDDQSSGMSHSFKILVENSAT